MSYLKELIREQESLSKLINESATKATCAVCRRSYWATEAYVAMVQSGRAESICGYCDGSHGEKI